MNCCLVLIWFKFKHSLSNLSFGKKWVMAKRQFPKRQTPRLFVFSPPQTAPDCPRQHQLSIPSWSGHAAEHFRSAHTWHQCGKAVVEKMPKITMASWVVYENHPHFSGSCEYGSQAFSTKAGGLTSNMSNMMKVQMSREYTQFLSTQRYPKHDFSSTQIHRRLQGYGGKERAPGGGHRKLRKLWSQAR